MQQRTPKQNNSLHLYLKLLSDELNNAGLDMRQVLKPTIDIPWNEKNAKEFLWRPIQKSLNLKESTTALDKAEINQVYEVLQRHISEKFGIYVAFPSEENTENYYKSLEK